MKLCKDCKWCKVGKSDDQMEFAKCEHPNNRKYDLVSGRWVPKVIWCSTLRSQDWFFAVIDGECSRGGRLFEPKEEEVK